MIEKLFSSKISFKILDLLFQRQSEAMATSEIVKLSGKKQANVFKELDKLVALNIIVKEKQGNQNLFKINSNFSYFKPLKELFEWHHKKDKKYFLFNEEGGSCLLSLNYFFRGFVSDYGVKKGVIKRPSNIISHFKDNYAKFFFEEEVIEDGAKDGLKMMLSDASFVQDVIYKESVELGDKALGIFQDLRKKDFKLPPDQAVEFIDTANEIITKQISLNFIAVFDLKDQAYSNYFKKHLELKNKSGKYKTASLMEKLLVADYLTCTQLLRLDVLKLAIAKKKQVKDFDDNIENIWQNWQWLNYGYRGPALSLDYFENVLNELVDKPIDTLEEELNELNNWTKNNRNNKEKIYQELNIDKKHRDFIDALSLLAYLKVYRKDTAFLLIFLTHKILEQYNKNLKFDNLLYLTLEEAKQLIEGKLIIDKKELMARENNCVQIASEDRVYIGDQANKILEESVKEDDGFEGSGQLKLLEGSVACLGKTGDWVYGEVKIINTSDDMAKMNEGDILVSVATIPDILPAMKKAAAIVTDHGGITCHAAIVSRELNIPCLIATKYATKVFKDGDRVVVCPRHSYIKFQ